MNTATPTKVFNAFFNNLKEEAKAFAQKIKGKFPNIFTTKQTARWDTKTATTNTAAATTSESSSAADVVVAANEGNYASIVEVARTLASHATVRARLQGVGEHHQLASLHPVGLTSARKTDHVEPAVIEDHDNAAAVVLAFVNACNLVVHHEKDPVDSYEEGIRDAVQWVRDHRHDLIRDLAPRDEHLYRAIELLAILLDVRVVVFSVRSAPLRLNPDATLTVAVAHVRDSQGNPYPERVNLFHALLPHKVCTEFIFIIQPPRIVFTGLEKEAGVCSDPQPKRFACRDCMPLTNSYRATDEEFVPRQLCRSCCCPYVFHVVVGLIEKTGVQLPSSLRHQQPLRPPRRQNAKRVRTFCPMCTQVLMTMNAVPADLVNEVHAEVTRITVGRFARHNTVIKKDTLLAFVDRAGVWSNVAIDVGLRLGRSVSAYELNAAVGGSEQAVAFRGRLLDSLLTTGFTAIPIDLVVHTAHDLGLASTGAQLSKLLLDLNAVLVGRAIVAASQGASAPVQPSLATVSIIVTTEHDLKAAVDALLARNYSLFGKPTRDAPFLGPDKAFQELARFRRDAHPAVVALLLRGTAPGPFASVVVSPGGNNELEMKSHATIEDNSDMDVVPPSATRPTTTISGEHVTRTLLRILHERIPPKKRQPGTVSIVTLAPKEPMSRAWSARLCQDHRSGKTYRLL